MSKKDFKVYVCFTGVVITIIMFLVGIMPKCVYASEGSGVNNNYTWGQESAKIFEAQQITKGSNDVLVGIIDTGIQYTHSCMDYELYCSEYSYSFFGSSGMGHVDPFGHGTNVAGIVAAQSSDVTYMGGITPNIGIVSLRISDNMRFSQELLLQAIEHASLKDIPILNFSGGGILDGSYMDDIREAIEEYCNNGGLLIVSAGNDAKNIDIDPCYPASFDLTSGYGNILNKDNIISVGALDVDGTIAVPGDWDDPTKGSNYGATSVDLFAPGTNIYTTSRLGGYEYVSGTSFAAPYVTGVAAMLKSIDPTLTGAQIKNIILNNVDEVSALEGKCVTGGKLNALKAVASIAFDYEDGELLDINFTPNGPLTILSDVFGDGITSIGANVFANCTALTSITIPSSVTSIGAGAFSGCTSLSSVVLPTGLTSIATNTFAGCSALTSITIPSSVTTIGNNAFDSSGLTGITIPNSVTSIGDYVFKNCVGLTEITIPSSVNYVGSSAFSGWCSDQTITIEGYVGADDSWSDLWQSGCNAEIEYTEEEPAEALIVLLYTQVSGGYAVYANPLFADEITEVTIPSTYLNIPVIEIADNGFEECGNLQYVIIEGNNLLVIGEMAFADCGNLKEISLPNSVTSIEEEAFYNCVELKSVNIPRGIDSIGENIFGNCNNLTSITIAQEAASNLEGIVFLLYTESCTIYTDGAREETEWYINQLGVASNVFYNCVFSDDGEYVVSAEVGEINGELGLSPPHREGYEFLQWDTEEGNAYSMDDLISGELAGVTLYSIWGLR